MKKNLVYCSGVPYDAHDTKNGTKCPVCEKRTANWRGLRVHANRMHRYAGTAPRTLVRIHKAKDGTITGCEVAPVVPAVPEKALAWSGPSTAPHTSERHHVNYCPGCGFDLTRVR